MRSIDIRAIAMRFLFTSKMKNEKRSAVKTTASTLTIRKSDEHKDHSNSAMQSAKCLIAVANNMIILPNGSI